MYVLAVLFHLIPKAIDTAPVPDQFQFWPEQSPQGVIVPVGQTAVENAEDRGALFHGEIKAAGPGSVKAAPEREMHP